MLDLSKFTKKKENFNTSEAIFVIRRKLDALSHCLSHCYLAKRRDAKEILQLSILHKLNPSVQEG